MGILILLSTFCVILSQTGVLSINSAEPIGNVDVKTSYEFTLIAKQKLTMAWYNDENLPVLADFNTDAKKLVLRDMNSDVCNDPLNQVVTAAMQSKMIISDGKHRIIPTINGSLPGPKLVVYEDSLVTAHVTNYLTSPITIHWHGLPQTNNFWNDGVGRVSQHPILPGETYTYTFTATPAGSFWYHGHYGSDRPDGLYGQLIILKKPQNNTAVIPPSRQFPMVLTDWFQKTAETEYLTEKWSIGKYAPGLDQTDKCYQDTRTFDSSRVAIQPFYALLVNGKGWNDQTMLYQKPTSLPLEHYEVKSGQTYLFRAVVVGLFLPMMVSIQDHNMTIVATDGEDITPLTVDYFIIYIGERIDFTVTMKTKPTRQTYFIQIRTLETTDINYNPLQQPHMTLAEIHYSDQPHIPQNHISPDFSFANCNTGKMCRIGACPFPIIQPNLNIDCVKYADMQNVKNISSEVLGGNVKDFFVSIYVDNSLNGYQFYYPLAPPALAANPKDVYTDCPTNCTNIPCQCTQIINVPKGSIMQLVFANIHAPGQELGDRQAHPMHIHGHHLYVVRAGYGTYDKTTGHLKNVSQDIDCSAGPTKCKWSNDSWANGNLPSDGTNLVNPILKDTIPVPVGGYVVLRQKADNPGYWMTHCHIMLHHLNGMATIIQIGTDKDLPPKPKQTLSMHFGGATWTLDNGVHPPPPKPSSGYTIKCFSYKLLIISIVPFLMLRF